MNNEEIKEYKERLEKSKEALKIKLYNEGCYIKVLQDALHDSAQEKLKRNGYSHRGNNQQLKESTEKLYKILDKELDSDNLRLETLTEELTKEYNEDCNEEILNDTYAIYKFLAYKNKRIRKIIDDYHSLENQIYVSSSAITYRLYHFVYKPSIPTTKN